MSRPFETIGDYIDWQLEQKRKGELNEGIILELAYVDRIYNAESRASNAEMMLRENEWDSDPESNYAGCGWCSKTKKDGHSDECPLGRFLDD
jgi:hypothetical protein